MQVIELLALPEDRCLRRVEVLRFAGAEQSAAKADDPAAQVVDWKEEATAEPRREGAVVAPDRQPRLDQDVIGDAELTHRRDELAAAGGKPEPQRCRGIEGEFALQQVASRRLRLYCVAKLRGKPVLRHVARLEERLAGIGTGALRLLRNRDAVAPRHLAHRRRIVEAEAFAIPGEDVARRVAHEAVVAVVLREHGEVAVRPAMEWARAAPVAPGALELDLLGHDFQQVGSIAHLLDHVIGNPCHQRSTATVTPIPPCCRGAKSNDAIRLSAARSERTVSRSTPVPIPWMIAIRGCSASTA